MRELLRRWYWRDRRATVLGRFCALPPWVATLTMTPGLRYNRECLRCAGEFDADLNALSVVSLLFLARGRPIQVAARR